MPPRHLLDGLPVEGANTFDDRRTLQGDLGKRLKCRVRQIQLTSPENLRMTLKYLLGQRSARAGKSEDENGPFRFNAEAFQPFETSGRKSFDQIGNGLLVDCGVITLAAQAVIGEFEGIGATEVLGGRSVFALRVQDLGQSGVQGRLLTSGEAEAGDASSQVRQVVLRQFVSQQDCQFAQSTRMTGFIPQRLAPAALRFGEFADLLKILTQIIMRGSVLRAQLQCPPVTGDRRVDLPPVMEGETQVVVRFSEIGIELQCPLEAGDGIVQLAHVAPHTPRVVVRCGEVGLQLQGPLGASSRFIQPTVESPDSPQVIVRLSIVGGSSSTWDRGTIRSN